MNLFPDLIVDNFAGGGGASLGIEMAVGRHVDIAINHDPAAIAMHSVNHATTKHYCESVWDIDPREVTNGWPVSLCWFSPDCKHFSKAKGGRPVEKNIRGLAWVAVRWAATVKPRLIILENVEEFKTWGPLLTNGLPDPHQKGKTFRAFVNAFKRQGYHVEWRELRACDYGAPTIRKRLFLMARCDGRPIVWPEPTHGDPNSDAVKRGKLKPWRTAAEIIDWSIPCPSIFERKKPLSENTLRRIAKGIQKFVIDNPAPFVIKVNHGGDDFRGQEINEPLQTVTAKNGWGLVTPYVVGAGGPSYMGKPASMEQPIGTIVGENHRALIAPYIARIGQTGFGGDRMAYSAEDPLTTVVSKAEHLLISPTLIQMGYGDAEGRRVLDLEKPVGTVTAGGNKFAIATAMIARQFGQSVGSAMDAPIGTVTAGGGGKSQLVTSHLIKLRGTCQHGQAVTEPMPTVTAGGMHIGEVRSFLIKYYGTGEGQQMDDPLHTVTTKDRFGLVTVQGEQYQIVDIGMRMLEPRELFRAQGFPNDYIIDFDVNGRRYSKKDQVARCGNSVSPVIPAALVRANLPDVCREEVPQRIATG